MFITFEGIDYSGKTTQATLLVERLKQRGMDVMFLREPGGTVVSEKVRSILLDRAHLELSRKAELLLFSAARAQLVEEVILPALQSGKTVICDRFYDSTTAYQGYGRGIDLDDVRALNRIATSGTSPDLTVLVDVDSDEIARRQHAAGLTSDRMESSGDHFFEKVRLGYLALARAEPSRFVVVQGIGPIDEIHNNVWAAIQHRFQ